MEFAAHILLHNLVYIFIRNPDLICVKLQMNYTVANVLFQFLELEMLLNMDISINGYFRSDLLIWALGPIESLRLF